MASILPARVLTWWDLALWLVVVPAGLSGITAALAGLVAWLFELPWSVVTGPAAAVDWASDIVLDAIIIRHRLRWSKKQGST